MIQDHGIVDCRFAAPPITTKTLSWQHRKLHPMNAMGRALNPRFGFLKFLLVPRNGDDSDSSGTGSAAGISMSQEVCSKRAHGTTASLKWNGCMLTHPARWTFSKTRRTEV